MVLEPEMDAGLVADLDRQRQMREDDSAMADMNILGLPGEVRAVEIEQVDILDTIAGGAAGQVVTDAVVERAGNQHPLWQVELLGRC